jgi:hypothetical protein
MLFIGTTVPLGSGADWESDSDSYPGYPVQSNYQKILQGSVFADQAGTLYVEQSGDMVNWDLQTTITVTASTGEAINVTVVLPWVRVRYVNGGSDQTIFRIFATLNDTGSGEPG